MKESYYFHNNTVILNYSKKYIRTSNELVQSEGFDAYLDYLLPFLKKHHYELYAYVSDGYASLEDVKKELKLVLRYLTVMEVEELDHPYLAKRHMFEALIEEGYNCWRSLQRYSVLFSSNEDGYQQQNFIEADSFENTVVLKFYRKVQERIQGGQNKVYRQLQAGTNASVLLQYYDTNLPSVYDQLQGIPFINRMMLRTPLILHPKSNKRKNVFAEIDHNPIHNFVKGVEEWICYPAKVGSLLIFAYFHRDHISSAIALANLFELASLEEANGVKPDAILLFGNKDGTKDTVFHYDVENDIWVGKVSDSEEIDYFGYTKKALLTLHNCSMMQKGWLPIHGAMVNMYLKDGTKKGLMFMGDSGAGKSETIEALSILASDLIDHQEIVFDDMGSIHLDANGNVVAQGSEIGAFVRLDDLDKGTAYRDMDRSIFFSPEKMNARVVLPASTYRVITTDQKVDCFLYANNYTDCRGLRFFENQEEAKQTFIEGKRFALGTTQEKGISTTFFSNPFGPVQKKEECMPLIDRMFDALYQTGIPVGEVYTCLGLENKGDHGIDEAAKALLEFVKQK